MTDHREGLEALYPEITESLQALSRRLNDSGGQWLLGGSCGLWLQNVPLATTPRDIDVYADLMHAETMHGLLADIAVDEPKFDESGHYSSLLSHYRLESLTLELVGGFQVKTEGAWYRTEVSNILAQEASVVKLGGASLHLMPLAHEFIFNVLRARPDRYLPIAGIIRTNPQKHLPLLSVLLERNRWTCEMIAKMADLLDQPLLSGRWGELTNTN